MHCRVRSYIINFSRVCAFMRLLRCLLAVLASICLTLVPSLTAPSLAATSTAEPVSVSSRRDGHLQYVVGRIKIPSPPDQVWGVMANPFEFEQKISPKFKTERIITDTPGISILSCQVNIGFLLPPIHYTVESRYENRRTISFHSISGDLKDFRGSWQLDPADGGKASYVTYSMYVQPNLPVPQWLVRYAVRSELPRTLEGIRDRVSRLVARKDSPADRKLASTGEVRFN
jgi:hypothetical protein